MTDNSPIRLLLTGARRSHREAVRAAIEAWGNDFILFELSEADQLAEEVQARRAQIVLLIQPEIHELSCEYMAVVDGPSRVPVIAIGRRGAPPVTNKLTIVGLDGFLPLQELDKLPELVTRLIEGADMPAKAGGIQLSTRALRESQKLISIGRLTAEIAHEINNPLESVGNLLYLARSEPQLTEKASDYLRGAERELARVVQISKQTLSFHRESQKATMVDISTLMEEVVELYNRRIVRKGLDLVREYDSDWRMNALPGEIRQVLSNLVTNAIEASAMHGKLRLRIRNGCSSRGGYMVNGLRISIGDTGTGIPEIVRRRLGELFFTTKGQSGTGLGLWVTRSIVTRYGGTMRLKSSTGQQHGTVFHLFLPLELPTSTKAKIVNGPPEAPLSTGRQGGIKVKQISDHPSHRENQASPNLVSENQAAICHLNTGGPADSQNTMRRRG